MVRKQSVLTWKALRKQMRLNWKQVGAIVVVRLCRNAVETLGDRIFMASCIHSEVVFLTKVLKTLQLSGMCMDPMATQTILLIRDQ